MTSASPKPTSHFHLDPSRKNCPCTFKGRKMCPGDSQGGWTGREDLSSGLTLCLSLGTASVSNFTLYKLTHFWVHPNWDTCPVGKHMCLPQPACFEHLLSIITLSKAGGEGAQSSSAWQCRSHDGAHFSLICCGTLDARWNLRDEIWTISCFSSFWTVINTIKKAEQWGFPTPLLSRPISKAVAEMPSAAFVDPGLRSPCSLLSNRKAEQIKLKLSMEGWRRGRQGRAMPQPMCPLCSLYSQVPRVKLGEAEKPQQCQLSCLKPCTCLSRHHCEAKPRAGL